jgi:hypothetical protein
MDAEQLRRLRLAHPFKAFQLILNNGRHLPVTQPYYMAISPVGNAILVATGGENVEMFKPEWVKEAIPLEQAGNLTRPMPQISRAESTE